MQVWHEFKRARVIIANKSPYEGYDAPKNARTQPDCLNLAATTTIPQHELNTTSCTIKLTFANILKVLLVRRDCTGIFVILEGSPNMLK